MVGFDAVLGRAYRGGKLVCDAVEIIVGESYDHRVGLAPRERRCIATQFRERLDPALREELQELLDARGPRGLRLAETLAPIEIVVSETNGQHRLTGRLEPPTTRNLPLEAISFRLREQGCPAG